MARDLLMPSLRPLLMLMLLLTLGWPTDTPATATDSTGHTDTVHTTVDISDIMEDTDPTDIPTTDKDIAARFLFFEYLPRYYPNVFREPISKC